MTLLEKLLDRPDANLLIEKAQEILSSESKRRLAFYDQISPNDKAEFILGEAIFHSPVKSNHNSITGRIFMLLNAFVLKNESGKVGIEKLLISLTRNDYEPDVCFFLKEKSEKFTPDQMRFPAPDLVVEVLSESTKERDRGIKFDDYQAHGVQEYWIVEPDEQIIEQYSLVDGKYQLILKTPDGNIHSTVLPNFVVSVKAFFSDDENLAALRTLI